MEVKEKYGIDISVLLIFFNNPERFEKVFKQVEKVKPSRLFLYQDGPRSPKDENGVLECRKIVDNISWECEVHMWYQNQNIGCDPSEYIAQKWAFSMTDKCIVLEDDDIPSLSFFYFCKELLDKYENDTRVGMIAGMNHEEITTDVIEDYFFTTNVSIWGWATWKRVVDAWDEKYLFLDNEYITKQMKIKLKNIGYRKDFFPMLIRHKKSDIAHYESILMSYMLLTNSLSIVPTKNMITNIGMSNGTHSFTEFDCLPSNLKKLYTLKRYEITHPMKHPSYMIEHYEYKKRVYYMMGWNHPILMFYRKVVRHVLKLKNLIIKQWKK